MVRYICDCCGGDMEYNSIMLKYTDDEGNRVLIINNLCPKCKTEFLEVIKLCFGVQEEDKVQKGLL